MKFQYFKDNENLIRRLEGIIAGGRVSHAYILEGDARIDKCRFAESFAKGILCPEGLGENCGRCSLCDKIDHGNCEDLIYVRPEESGSVKTESIEGMQEKIKTKPYGERHVVIIESADTMTRYAQNRLLKTLEEPPGSTVLILLSENMEDLVPTIRSRCVKFHIEHSADGSDQEMQETARQLIELLGKRATFYELVTKTKNAQSGKQDAQALLDSMEAVYRELLISGAGKVATYSTEDIAAKIHCIESAAEDLRIGVAPATAVKDLLIRIGG